MAKSSTEDSSDFASISMGASIEEVSSGLFGTDACSGSTGTGRFPCSDPRDAIDRLSQYSLYSEDDAGEFIFGPGTPQYLIVDLGQIRKLDLIGADFASRGDDRPVGSFGVFVSLDGKKYIPLSAPVDNPNPPILFRVESPVEARFVAYYFGNCVGPNCPGSRILEVYAIPAAK